VIVQTRARDQAARVADLTGGTLLHDDQGRPTAKVTLGDFDARREAVESVSVLFRCFDDHGTELPSGWVVTGATFDVEWPREPERRSWLPAGCWPSPCAVRRGAPRCLRREQRVEPQDLRVAVGGAALLLSRHSQMLEPTPTTMRPGSVMAFHTRRSASPTTASSWRT